MKETFEKLLMDANDLMNIGLNRPMVYQLLNRTDLPVIQIGGRKFMHRELFLKWLESQAMNNTTKSEEETNE